MRGGDGEKPQQEANTCRDSPPRRVVFCIMSKQRIIKDEVWDDEWFYDLDPIEKLVWLFLLTNNRCNIAGVYKLNQKWAARITGLDSDLFPKIINRFVEDKKLYIDGEWVVIINFTKHQAENPSVKQGINRIINRVSRPVLDRLSQAVPDCPTLLYLTLPIVVTKVTNQEDMWKNKSDDYLEGIVDLDGDGEINEEKEVDNTPNRKRMDELVDWLINYQGRDKLRTNRPKQYKALKELVKMKVTGAEAQQTIIEATSDPYWKGKKEKPDFSTVVSIMQKRG